MYVVLLWSISVSVWADLSENSRGISFKSLHVVSSVVVWIEDGSYHSSRKSMWTWCNIWGCWRKIE